MKKKLALLIAGALLVGSMSGCGAADTKTSSATVGSSVEQTGKEAGESTGAAAEQTIGAENQIKSEETLTVAFAGEPEGMTRLSATGSIGLFINPNYGFLLKYNPDTKEIESGIADYEAIDETHYRFTIKEGMVFSDGTPITTEDVLYTVQCLKKTGVESTNYLDVDNFVIEDERNIIVALTKYELGWDYWFADEIPVFSKASIDEIGLENTLMEAPVSCGKYMVKEWNHGQYILYERNENYWDDSSACYYKYLKYTFVPDAASRMLAVRSGDADVADGMTVSDYKSLANDPEVTAEGYDSGKTLNLLMNCEKITDIKVREAIAHAVNAESVNAIMNLGMGRVEQGYFPSTFPHYISVYEGDHVSYDPELTKQLLAEAGYANGLSLKLICLRANASAAGVVQEDLRQAGIEVEVNIMDQMAYLDTSKSGDYDLQITTNTAVVPSNQNFAQIDPKRIGKAANSIRYDSEELSAAIEESLSSDPAVSKAGYEKVTKIILENYCLVGLCNADYYCAYDKDLTGMKIGSRLNRIDYTQFYPKQ